MWPIYGLYIILLAVTIIPFLKKQTRCDKLIKSAQLQATDGNYSSKSYKGHLIAISEPNETVLIYFEATPPSGPLNINIK